jgi:HPt (histidine-containing phosphotransfer) domain-containing protein
MFAVVTKRSKTARQPENSVWDIDENTLTALLSYSSSDYVQLEIDAHTIKGVAANLGITSLSKEAEVLELAVKIDIG